MYAHEYAKKHFKHKTNFEGLVVFSDALQNKIKDTTIPSENQYLEIEKGIKDPNKWFIHFNSRLSGEYGDFYLENNPTPAGETNLLEYEVTDESYVFMEQHVISSQTEAIPYYKINEKYYIRLSVSVNLNEVIITGKSSQSNGSKQQSVELDAFVTLFVSENGARLEHAYQNIKNINTHEVVILIERNSGTNAFGTVFRIKKGKNVQKLIETDRLTIARVARAYGVAIGANELSTIIQEQLKQENRFYFLLSQTLTSGGRIARWASDESLTAVSSGVKTISKEIDELKLGENYWKTLIDGKPNPKYNPLLPKIDGENGINVEAFTKTVYKNYLEPLTITTTKMVTTILDNKFLKKLVPFNLNKVIAIINQIPEVLKNFFDNVVDYLVDLYQFINGLLVGLINSIIDFIKSIFDILGMLFDIINAAIQSTKFFENPASYLSLFVESFENLLDSFVNAFTFENLKKFIGFLAGLPKQAYTAIVNAINNVSEVEIDAGAIGYYLGFLVGFIASEVVTFFATGGTGNIAKAVKAVFKSYKELATVTAKTVNKTVTFTLNSFVKIVDNIVTFSKNIPKYLDDLKSWIDEFVESLKGIGNKLFKGFEAVLDLLYDLGVVIVEKLDPKTGKVLVQGTGGIIYAIKQNDKTIFEGTQDAIKQFAKKIDEIRSSGGNTKQKVQKHLDELVKQVKLKVKQNEKTIDLVDENNIVVFRGVNKADIEKYITFIKKPLDERKALVKQMLERLKSNSNKYKPEKAKIKGYEIPKSKNGTSPDFSELPEHLYKGKLDFGKVKIKVTGSRDKDFAQAFDKMNIDNKTRKIIKEEYTWHHLDDLDENLESTMQLVLRNTHEATYKHLGSAKQFQEILNIKNYLS